MKKLLAALLLLTSATMANAQSFIYDMSDEWNNGAVAFDAIKMNVTDTASLSSSKLINLLVGGVSKFCVLKDGSMCTTNIGTRHRLQAATTYYIRTDGSDSNDGLTNTAGGAWASFTHAWKYISGLDINGHGVTVTVQAGTYNDGFSTHGDLTGVDAGFINKYFPQGGATVSFGGDIFAPDSYIIKAGARSDGRCFEQIGDNTMVDRLIIQGFMCDVDTTTTGAGAVSITGKGNFTFTRFNASDLADGENAYSISGGATATVSALSNLSGDMNAIVHCNGVGTYCQIGGSAAWGINGSPSYNTAAISVVGGAFLQSFFNGATGVSTGKKYSVTGGSKLEVVSGTTLTSASWPGDTIGTCAGIGALVIDATTTYCALAANSASTDAGAVGPVYIPFHDSTSPAAADVIFEQSMRGRDSANNIQEYAQVKTIIDDPTAGSADARMTFEAVSAGVMVPVVREKLINDRVYYVRTDGSNSNDGLSDTAGGAWATVNYAWKKISRDIDLGGRSVTVNIRAGTFADGIYSFGETGSAPDSGFTNAYMPQGSGTVTFDGAGHASTVLQDAGGPSACISFSAGHNAGAAQIIFSDFHCDAFNVHFTAFSSQAAGTFVLRNLKVSNLSAAFGFVMRAIGPQFVQIDGASTVIDGDMESVITAADGARVTKADNWSITGAPSYSGAAFKVSGQALLSFSGTMAGATGKTYDVTTGGVAIGSAANLAGDTTGTCSVGGVVHTGSAFLCSPANAANQEPGAAGPVMLTDHDSASPAASDVIFELSNQGNDSGAANQEYAQVQTIIDDPTAASEDATMKWGVVTGGTVANELVLNGTALYPEADLGLSLGTSTNRFSGVREKLTAARTYYVRTDGSDSNNGLADTAGGAWLSLTHAWKQISAIDTSGFEVLVEVRDGSHTAGFTTYGDVTGPDSGFNRAYAPIGGGSVRFLGDTTTPSLVDINATARSNGGCFEGAHQVPGVVVFLQGLQCDVDTATVGNFFALSMTESGYWTWANGRIEDLSSSETAITFSGVGGVYNFQSTTVDGDMAMLLNCTDGAECQVNTTITLTGAPSYSTAGAQAQHNGMLNWSSAPSGAATGIKFLASRAGIVRGAVNPPGDTPGTCTSTAFALQGSAFYCAAADLANSDPGAVGPVMTTYQDSASPAAADVVFEMSMTGEDSAGNTQEYGQMQMQIDDATSASEDSTLLWGAVTGGTVANEMSLTGTVLSLLDENELRFFEEDAGGTNYVGFKAPAALTASVTCTFENDANPIPDSCVGDGVDDTGAGGGDALRVEDSDNAGTFTAAADPDFIDDGDINFVLDTGATPDTILAELREDLTHSGATATLTSTSTDAGATGTQWIARHDSASPADGDLALDIQVFAGADDEEVARIALEVDDGATTTEDTRWRFFNDTAGVSQQTAAIGDGMVVGPDTALPGEGAISLYKQDDGGTGPTSSMTLDTATPAAGDVIGEYRWLSKDSGGNGLTYVAIGGFMTDPTDTSEDGRIYFQTVSAGGALTSRMRIENGVTIGASNTTFPGDGSLSVDTDLVFNGAGGIINFNAGDVLLTHSSNLLTLSGGGLDVTGVNSFTGPFGAQNYNIRAATSGAFEIGLLVEATSAGQEGPQIATFHNSATPAANDSLFFFASHGKDSAANTIDLGFFELRYTDPTDTTEDTTWLFASTVNGEANLDYRMGIHEGIFARSDNYFGWNNDTSLTTAVVVDTRFCRSAAGVVKVNTTDCTTRGDLEVLDEAYNAGTWDGSLEVPTKNAIRDKIETMGGGGTPGGSDTHVQFNDGGSTFGGDSGFTFTKATDKVTIGTGAAGSGVLVNPYVTPVAHAALGGM